MCFDNIHILQARNMHEKNTMRMDLSPSIADCRIVAVVATLFQVRQRNADHISIAH